MPYPNEHAAQLKNAGLHGRAYALLEIKAYDEERREITGVATTPTPDRVGDVIEPLGITFRNPVPLLLYHDTQQPVGTATLDKPTKAGVTFKARLPKIEEPGRLKDRVDEAWQSIKARLIRGISIGFRILNDAVERIQETEGFRLLETEVLEISLVAIPMNYDTRIDTIKACDALQSAAAGTAARVSSPSAGVAAFRKDRTMNASEELTAKRAELKTKNDRLHKIREGVEGEVPSDALKLEAKALTAEIGELADTCEQLQAHERAQAQLAVPVVPKAIQEPSTIRSGGVAEVKSNLPPGVEFARYVICKMAALVSQGEKTALTIARERYPDHPRIQYLLKAAVTPHSTIEGAQTGGTELVYAQNLVSEFIEFLRPMTIIGKFGTGSIPSLRRVPFNVRITGQSSGGAGYWVGQKLLKPLTKFDFSSTTLTWAKVAAISVISDELARFSSPSAETLVRDALAQALVERLDIDFVDPAKAVAANVSPASITNGIVPLVSSGTDAAALRLDLQQLFAAFILANNPPTSGVFIMPNTIALAISLMRNALGQKEFPDITMLGGTLEGLPVIASQHAAIGSPVSNLLILVNAGDIFLSDDGQVAIDASREASLEMESDPENQAGTVVSMYQANLIALRAERYINWERRRESAVAYLDGVAYSAGSP